MFLRHDVSTGEGDIAYHRNGKKDRMGGQPGHLTNYLSVRIKIDDARQRNRDSFTRAFDLTCEEVKDICLALPSPKKYIKEAFIVGFDGWKTSQSVISELAAAGLRPVTLWEFLALAEQHNQLLYEFPAACLGTAWQNKIFGKVVPYWQVLSDSRTLDLMCYDADWQGYWRFPSIRQKG